MIYAPQKWSVRLRSAAAICLALVTVALQWLLALLVDERIPFLLFMSMVVLSSVLLGTMPAVIVHMTGLMYGVFMLFPIGSFEIAEFGDQVSVIAYACFGFFFAIFGGKIRKITYQAAQAEQILFAQRLHTQKMAQENDARFRAALDSSAVPFNILAPVKDDADEIIDFRWTYLNAAAQKIMGMEVESVVGKRVFETLPRLWDVPGLFDRYVAVSLNDKSQSFELYLKIHPLEGWFHIIASPFHGSVAVWLSDVTERKLQEQILKQTDQRKDEFLATLAHELRNPLAPIRQAAAILNLSEVTDEQRNRSNAVIERQVNNMALLLDDLLDVSRITRGSLTLHKSVSSMQSILETAIEIARPLIESRKHDLSVSPLSNALYVDADPLRIAQIVSNLLVNAAKYTDTGGLIQLEIAPTAEDITITVTDNGIGIKPDKLTEIFTMFAQINSPKDGLQGGLGIGLALSKGLIELHGGRIEAYSAGLGKGSRFTVYLPKAAQMHLDDSSTAAHMQALGGNRRKVLIADDNRDAADTMAMLLELEGHQVHVAYDGEAAISAFVSFQPEIALLDIGMPRLSGIEVAKRIRSMDSGKKVTLVAITGWGQSTDRIKTMDAGFNVHLTKPVDTKRVRDLLAAESARVDLR